MTRMEKKNATAIPLVTSQYSPVSFLIGCVFTSLYTIPSVSSLVKLINYHEASSEIIAVSSISCILRMIGSMFMFIIWLTKRRSDDSYNTYSPITKSVMQVLENSYFTFLILSLTIRLVSEILVGQCDHETLPVNNSHNCNAFQDVKMIQPSYLIALMFTPLLAYFLIRETSPISIAVAWVISVGTLLWCTAYMNSLYLALPTFAYFIASLLMLYVSKRQNDDMLQLVRALQIAAAENERLQDEARATELRAMIGNVAHDLKTVSYYLPIPVCIEPRLTCSYHACTSHSR